MAQYSIGIDFGTLSVRAVLANTETGHVLAQSVFKYPHKILTALPDGTPLPDGTAYAHPSDYIDGLQQTVRQVLKQSDISAEDVIGIGVDCTSCSVVPIDKNGVPLCMNPNYENHAHAYIKLWKHHTAAAQATKLQRIAETRGERFLSDCGNTINCESFFPKVLETFEQDREVYNAAYAFMEVGEWIVLLLTGNSVISEPMAAFKRFYHPFRGYPDPEFFEAAANGFGAVVKEKLHGKILSVGQPAGQLHPRMAKILGLPESVVVAAPSVDAHTAVPACGGKEGDLICIMGTSGVSLLVSHNDTGMDGVYSSACHAFLPDTFGHEAGQSSVGDTLAWFASRFVSPEYVDKALEEGKSIQEYLTKQASEIPAGGTGLLALDWNNGVRTPFMDYSLSGAWLGLTNNTRPEEIYRALLESIAFGARRIKDIYEHHGHKILRIICAGGVAQKNKLFCQIMADVMGKEISVCTIPHVCALGSAVNGAIAASDGQNNRSIIAAMSDKETEQYRPDFVNQETYSALFKEYLKLSDFMSGYQSVMRQCARWRNR